MQNQMQWFLCGLFACWILAQTSLLARLSLHKMCSILQRHFISTVCSLLCSSAVRIHDSEAYRKMDVTRERISHIMELREILSFQTGFNLVNASVVCAILASISGLEPSSVIIEPRYSKLVIVSSFCPFILISVLMPLVLFGLLSTDLHAGGCGGFV